MIIASIEVHLNEENGDITAISKINTDQNEDVHNIVTSFSDALCINLQDLQG